MYGEYRPVPPPAPKAFLASNEQFLEVRAGPQDAQLRVQRQAPLPSERLGTSPSCSTPLLGPCHPPVSTLFLSLGGGRFPPVTCPQIVRTCCTVDSLDSRAPQVEAETDRRVRTSSVVLKKNALLAPSVQQVRRAGLHVRAGGPKSV